MSKKDLNKETLYEGVKSLVDVEADHIHLTQKKLYTLFSLAFNYMLYRSSKDPGHYIIRIEDSNLLDKLIRKSKDDSTRKFLNRMQLPRKLKYERSMFHIDFFNFTTWANTNELPKEKVKGAIIVKNANKSPIGSAFSDDEMILQVLKTMPEDFYVSTLTEFVPKTITIAYDETYEGLEELRFDFIKDEEEKLHGVTISDDLNF